MTNNPKISIIIPLYNVELYIVECLQSVARQTYKGEIECIVVDDCGTDGSVKIVDKFLEEYSGAINFTFIHHQRNRGVSAARNTGIESARGDYIFFLDSDDYISDDCLEVLSAPLAEYEYDVILGDVKLMDWPKNVVFLPEESCSIIGNGAIFRKSYVDRMVCVIACNKLIRAELFRRYDLTFLERLRYEDDLWSYKVNCRIESLSFQKRFTYFYRYREGSYMYDIHENRHKRAVFLLIILRYILNHPAEVPKNDYDRCVVYYWKLFLSLVDEEIVRYRKEYLEFRYKFDYHPIQLWLQGDLKFNDIRHQFYLVLPPFCGYLWLCLRSVKHRYLLK